MTDGGETIVFSEDFTNLSALLNRLGDMEIQRVLVEGGPVTIKHFLNAGLVDEFYLVKSEVVHKKPYSSGISTQVLDDADLQHNSNLRWGSDVVQLFNRL